MGDPEEQKPGSEQQTIIIKETYDFTDKPALDALSDLGTPQTVSQQSTGSDQSQTQPLNEDNSDS